MLKRGLSIFLATMMALSLSTCGPKRESAQTVVENAITAMKNMDLEAVQSYWGNDALNEAETLTNTDTDDQTLEVMKLLTQNLSYSVTNSQEDEDAGTATVSVDITNTDMSLAMAEYMSSIMSDLFTYAFLPEDQQPSDEELNQIYMDKLIEVLSAENTETVTTSVNIDLTLSDDQWKITPSEEVVDAMLGGILTYIDSMSEQLAGLAE